MRKFKNVNATTVDEAVTALGAANAWACAGGTDLVGMMKDDLLPDYPEVVVNLKTISPSLDYIKEEGGTLKIGALTRLEDIAKSSAVQGSWAALAEGRESYLPSAAPFGDGEPGYCLQPFLRAFHCGSGEAWSFLYCGFPGFSEGSIRC